MELTGPGVKIKARNKWMAHSRGLAWPADFYCREYLHGIILAARFTPLLSFHSGKQAGYPDTQLGLYADGDVYVTDAGIGA